jgi:UDP-N-acetylglucosamine--N-acetylmuramyl-(pentapeptide) pyrophosphoryl-undecaprenol N-acetylglucosamine transferase
VKNNIALVAGKSGGHLIPGLTYVASLVRKQKAESRVIVFATNTLLDKTIIETQSPLEITVQAFYVLFGSCIYYKLYHVPKALWHFVCSFLTSFIILYKERVTRIISMGGAISIPVCIAAKILRIPVEVIELNYEPGKAVKLLAAIAEQIDVCFSETQSFLPAQSIKRVNTISYPVRFNLNARSITAAQARCMLGLLPEKRTIVLLGGSQGSIYLNQLMQEWVSCFSEYASNIQIVHQAGDHDIESIKKHYNYCGVHALVVNYIQDIELLYRAADVVIGRSGAGTLAEVLFFDKCMLTIPLETPTTAHQKRNAYAYAQSNPNKIIVMEQRTITINDIDKNIRTLLM